ncbi:hypothetical protein K1T71_002931 [Dendrolimus kikuchii]|uniref:Uncharacterized protein n=1 Tax=Dendrolimus kikuchii TaxID=765133 RepID=A0ACC1DAL7_9NEOP|nr:hypothetical protein K1T71_002931 [Dendrolimus kikuchii]
MCNVCYKELKGWFKSFTRTEMLLTFLQAVLLIIFVAFLVFLILHFIACSKIHISNDITPILDTAEFYSTTEDNPTENILYPTAHKIISKPSWRSTKAAQTKSRTPASVETGVKCTWKVSQKTEANIHYFYPVTKLQTNKTTRDFIYNNKTVDDVGKDIKIGLTTDLTVENKATSQSSEGDIDFTSETTSDDDRDILSDISEGEDATEANKQHILALVKLKPLKGITFGCILTVVHEYWVLTAASCLEAIEEIDSLDNFIMMEGYGSDYSKNHAVADVQIHSLYQGTNRSYDLVLLKSEDSLVEGELNVVHLPELLDYFLITTGERFTVLGYGPFRTIDNSPLGNSLRRAYVHNLPVRQCPVPSDTWGLRTLRPGEPVAHAPCGTAPICAGVLFSRGTPCYYCAGTPLMHGSVLHGIMSDNQQCGVSCEPQIYVNIAVVKEWLYSVVDNK